MSMWRSSDRPYLVRHKYPLRAEDVQWRLGREAEVFTLGWRGTDLIRCM